MLAGELMMITVVLRVIGAEELHWRLEPPPIPLLDFRVESSIRKAELYKRTTIEIESYKPELDGLWG